MNISIQVEIDSSVEAIDRIENMEVYRFGTKFVLTAQFLNKSSGYITIDNPQTSQQTLLLLMRHEDQEETLFEINPASIDVTGEITAPDSSNITLKTHESINLVIDYSERFEQSVFLPGTYELSIQYEGFISNSVKYLVPYDKVAKKRLLSIAIDEQADIEIRSLAVDYLVEQSEIDGGEILLPEHEESLEQRNQRAKLNQATVKQLLLMD